ncbi:hypothetical protein ACVSUB_13830 [Yersinia enterocolitica]
MSDSGSNSNHWVGYHGTSLSSACQILSTGFRNSSGEGEWLGHGVYFFIEGHTDPFVKAIAWAKRRSILISNRRHSSKYAVLETKIVTTAHLDLDDREDIEIFEKVREKCYERMESERFDVYAPAINNDCFLGNFVMDNLGLDALVRKEAIITGSSEFRTRIPNCRIMCLRNPDKCIQEKRIAKKGTI